MRKSWTIPAGVIVWAALVCAATGPATKPTTMPTTASADEIKALIEQLGNDEYATRDEASRKLAAIGKLAVPALRDACKSTDPEVAVRAESLLRRVEQRPVPEAPSSKTGRSVHSVKVSVVNGRRKIDVDENGRKIHVSEDENGINLTVTGVLDGKKATVEYAARTAQQLREENPEAYELYKKYAMDQNGGINIQGEGMILRGNVRMP